MENVLENYTEINFFNLVIFCTVTEKHEKVTLRLFLLFQCFIFKYTAFWNYFYIFKAVSVNSPKNIISYITRLITNNEKEEEVAIGQFS